MTVDYTGPTCYWDQEWHQSAPPPSANVLGVAPVDADVVVLQRPARRQWLQIINKLHQRGVKVVVDVDDAFYAIPEHNIAHRQFDPARSPYMNWEWIDACCRVADLVTTSSQALLDRYGYGHGEFLPNLIPAHYLTITPNVRSDNPTVGWTGSVETHGADLQVTDGAVQDALNQNPNWRAHVVGTGVGVKNALSLTEEPTAVGWVPFEQYPQEMAAIDLGIVPLALDTFNAGKSCLKLMEFASLGVPVVASPTPDNLRMHKFGIGIMAKPKRWRQTLTKLMADDDRRAELAEKGKEGVRPWTYSNCCDLWQDAWESVL